MNYPDANNTGVSGKVVRKYTGQEYYRKGGNSMLEKPKKIEHYEKCFGLIAVEKGFITPDELIRALTVQVREDIEHGNHRQLGEIFMDQDTMSPNQIEAVVKDIFQR